MVVDDAGKRKVDWLVNISNDGWYVKFDKDTGEVIPSGELSQRTAISVFRAVENRISILRSVNTGVSCIIDPVGNIRDGFIDGDLPVKAMDRVGVEGWFVDKIKIDKRVTFFGKHRQWLDLFFSAGFVCVIIIMSIESVLKRRGIRRKES
jgi:apolipoprotein N-acyltransferase